MIGGDDNICLHEPLQGNVSMRAVVLESFQGFTGRLVKMPFNVSSCRVCNDLRDLLVQFLEPFIDHDCTVSPRALA